MPRDFVGGSARVALAGKRMYGVVAGSSRPERTLKDEVFRLCDTMTSREVDAVLGKVYVKLGANGRTAPIAEYMKDLYGSGSRKLFVPKLMVDTSKLPATVPDLKLTLTDGSVAKVPLVDVPAIAGGLCGKSGRRKQIGVLASRLRAKARTKTVKPGAFSATEVTVSSGGNPNPNEVVTLQSVSEYCLKTANRYEEVKPVYDMLVELFSEKSCPEWKEIKASIRKRMETLPGKSHITVYGTHVEQQQIAHNVEKVETGGVGIMEKTAPAAPKRDGRKRKGHAEKVVKAVYKYSHMKDKYANIRLNLFYCSLVNKGWLDKETSPETFIDLFAGVPKEFTMKWVGTQSDLYALIKNMFAKGHISCIKGGSKWQIAGSHFLDQQSLYFTDWNKQKERKQSMSVIQDYMLLLDPNVLPTGELLKRLEVDQYKL